jgi:uncharacterized membrane protein YhaH (DUF805 family)
MSKPVFEGLFSFSGRRNRKSYLLYAILFAVLSFVLFLAVAVAAEPAYDEQTHRLTFDTGTSFMLTAVVSAIAFLALLASYAAVASQRCRDLGSTGWLLLLYFVPLVNLYLLFRLIFSRGTEGLNRYGEDPIVVHA